jgi:hypothetical protein
MKSKCDCKTPTNFDCVGLEKHEGEVRIDVQWPLCGVTGLLTKAETTPENIQFARSPYTKYGQPIALIGIEPELVEILP